MSGALPAPKAKKGAATKAPLSLSKNTKKKKNKANTNSKAGPFSSTTASPTSQSGNEHFFSPESINNKNNKNNNHVSAIRGGFLDAASSSAVASSSRADPSTQTDRNNSRKNKVDIRVHLTSGWRAKISPWGGSTASPARSNDSSEAAASASASSGQYYSPIENDSDEYDNKTKNTESASLMRGWRSNTSITKDDENEDDGFGSVDDPFTVPGSIARATPEPMWG
ncbi:hypothetical protein PG984_000246 [Apiospora sp. TS-2023a]